MSEIIILRQSLLNAWEICKEWYRRAIIEKEPSGRGTAAIRGTAVHAAAAENHRHKMAFSGKSMPMADMIEIANETFLYEVRNEDPFLTPEELEVGTLPSIARARMQARDMTEVYAREIAPKFDPILVEETITAEIDGSPVQIRGTIDALNRDYSLPDLKTTMNVRKFTQAEADATHQFTIYGLLVRAKTGRWPTSYRWEIVDGAKGRAKTVETYRTRGDVHALMARIRQMRESIDKGVFGPAPAGHWKCSQRWCSFWDTCPFVNSERAEAARLLGP